MSKITEHDAHIIGAMRNNEFTDEEIREALENAHKIRWLDWIFFAIIYIGVGFIIALVWFLVTMGKETPV